MWVSKRMAYEGALPMIEYHALSKLMLDLLQFLGFSTNVALEFSDGSVYDLQMVDDEVREIVVIRLGVEE